MKAAGESAHHVALVLKNGYGLDALAGAALLCVSQSGHPYPFIKPWEFLEFLRTTMLGGSRLRGVYLMADGRWFTDLSF